MQRHIKVPELQPQMQSQFLKSEHVRRGRGKSERKYQGA